MNPTDNEIFADTIAGVGLMAGMVRIDFGSFSAQEKDQEGRAVMAFRQRVVMPPEGFLRSFAAMQDLMRQLEKAGLVRRQAPPGESSEAVPAIEEKPKSPNFP